MFLRFIYTSTGCNIVLYSLVLIIYDLHHFYTNKLLFVFIIEFY